MANGKNNNINKNKITGGRRTSISSKPSPKFMADRHPKPGPEFI